MCQSILLRCDTGTIPADHYYANEIAMYCPVLVIFPEDQGSGPPWNHSADYHPRAIEIYLDNANPRSTNWWRAPGAFFIVTKPANAVVDYVTRIVRKVKDLVALRFDRPETMPQSLQEMLGKDPARGLPQMTLDAGVRPGERAWKKYFEILDENPEQYPHRCYVRVVRKGEDRVALQYWFFYYFNDFWNTHQTDFEVVTVFLRRKERKVDPPPDFCIERDDDGLKPTGCYFGAHRGGVYRAWDKGVWKSDGTHPIAYVAKGSHAMYAEPFVGKPHIPELPWFGWRISFLHLVGGVRQTFWGRPVPEVVVSLPISEIDGEPGGSYDVRIIPSSVECVRPGFPPGNSSFWNEWWWLRFRGRWGPGNYLRRLLAAQPGVGGPPFAPRWLDPWAYLEECSGEIDWHEF